MVWNGLIVSLPCGLRVEPSRRDLGLDTRNHGPKFDIANIHGVGSQAEELHISKTCLKSEGKLESGRDHFIVLSFFSQGERNETHVEARYT